MSQFLELNRERNFFAGVKFCGQVLDVLKLKVNFFRRGELLRPTLLIVV